MGATCFKEAPEVEEIAGKLIDTVGRHMDLIDVAIRYVFIDHAPISKGRVVLGRARKIGGLPAFLSGHWTTTPLGFQAPSPFFVIEISHDWWVGALTDAQKVALVDHELCHCRVDYTESGEQRLSIIGHDLEEFNGVIDRHGFWSESLTSLGQVMAEQLALTLDHLTEPGDPAA